MKTPEEIKRGMALCKMDECFGQHEDCPYAGEPSLCVVAMCDDGLAYIQQLERDNAQEGERVRKLERDNAYLMRIARDSCTMCKNVFVDVSDEPCASCINGHGARDNWEWRGVEEDNHAED